MTARRPAGAARPEWVRVVADAADQPGLAERLWPVVAADLDAPITPVGLADGARLTTGSAQSLLAGWAAAGRLDRRTRPGRHGGCYDDRYALPGTFVRALVTGSRTWEDAATLTAALHELATEHGDRLVIVHGGCRTGADAIADAWCRRTGTPVERWPADWSTGPGAGPARNTAMVATRPAACLAFLRGDTPGTTHCAATAEAAGIPTIRHRQDPAPTTRPGRPAVAGPAPRPPGPGREVSELLAAALAAAARGWHVLPLRPDDKRPAFPDHSEDHCTGQDPRCARAGRHVKPEERATVDTDRIRRAWSSRPYGIGIACGPSGLLVVDLDQPKPGQEPPPFWQRPGIIDGSDVFAVLAEEAGVGWPETHTVRTGRGGTHLYFVQPPAGPDRAPLGNTSGALGWLIDTRGHGGYVVAAGSTVTARPYLTAVDVDPVPLPDWLTDRLTRPARATGPAVVNLTTGRLPAYLRAAVAAEVATVAAATEVGARNHTLFVAATALGQLVAGGALTAELVTNELEQAGLSIGLSPAEVAGAIRSGLRTGARRPRTPGHPAAATRGEAA